MYITRLLASACAIVALAGCAHPMIIKPDIDTLVPSATSIKIQKSVGFYISAADRSSEITTAGGGGDKVRYHPYADMETGLYKIFSNVFTDVTVLSGANDTASIAKNKVVYVIEPKITTNSSSSGFFTWMATDFTVSLTCRISDTSGHQIANVASTGTGHAEFDELKANFSLAGQRAALDALLDEQTALFSSAVLRQ
jgi:hypothetical protein